MGSIIAIAKIAEETGRHTTVVRDAAKLLGIHPLVTDRVTGHGRLKVFGYADDKVPQLVTYLNSLKRFKRKDANQSPEKKEPKPPPVREPVGGPTEMMATIRKLVLLFKANGVNEFTWHKESGEVDIHYEPKLQTFVL